MGCRLEEREKEKGGRASERLSSRIAGGSKRGGNRRNRRKDEWTKKMLSKKEEHWKCRLDLLGTFLFHFASLLRAWQLRVARALSFLIPRLSPRDGALPVCFLSV